jgi:DNA-binding NarL/FixJ family response regulator
MDEKKMKQNMNAVQNQTEEKSIIKIILVDDHPLIRMGIKKVIEIYNDVEIVGETGDANEAISLARNLEPDIVVVDISLAGEVNGIDLVRALKARIPQVKTLILTMYDEKLYAERALKAGARGYVTKKDAPDKLVNAIRTVKSGELYLDDNISRKLLDKILHGSTNGSGSPVDILSNREFEIFQLIGEGLKTQEIGNL